MNGSVNLSGDKFYSKAIFKTSKNLIREGNRLTRREYDISKALRKKILKRDNYRCQLCGQLHGGKIELLHIHHIVPIMGGGSGDPSNLITLCKQCHLSLVYPVNYHPQVPEIIQVARRRMRNDNTDLKEKIKQINLKCTNCRHYYIMGLNSRKCNTKKCRLPDFKLYKPQSSGWPIE